MTEFSFRVRSLVTAGAALLVLSAGAPAAAKSGHKGHAANSGAKSPTFWAAGEIKWKEVPGMQGIWTADLWGDATKGAHGTMHKFLAGKVVPLHSHTADSKYVIVAGTLVNQVEGGAEMELPTGSYAMMPGGMKHTTKCKAGGDCILMLVQNGAWDVKMAEGAAAK